MQRACLARTQDCVTRMCVQIGMETAYDSALTPNVVASLGRRSLAPFPGGKILGHLEEPDQIADRVMAVLWMAERQFFVHLVVVPAPVARLGQIAGVFKIAHHVGGGSLSDTDGLRDVPDAGGGIGADDLEDVGVVRYEPEHMVAITGNEFHISMVL
jgi:hypothetical protein